MPFKYYQNLSPSQKNLYKKSDAIEKLNLKKQDDAKAFVKKLKSVLESEDKKKIKKYIELIAFCICSDLGISAPDIHIKSRRPSSSSEELQGLYEIEDDKPLITIWMKTYSYKRTVAFKTFLRTFLHELCHHIDFYYFAFSDSLHTEGFFKRESNLFKDICPKELISASRTKKLSVKEKRELKNKQLELF